MKNQRGYITWVLTVFAVLIGIMIFPVKFTKPFVDEACSVGQAPETMEVLTDLPEVPPIIERGEDYALGVWLPTGGPDLSTKADFVLIRKNVPLPERSAIDGYEFLGKDLFTYMSHTGKVGEYPQKPGYEAYYPTWGGLVAAGQDLSFLTEGLVFFINKDPGTNIQLGGQTIRTADIYQDKRIYDKPDKKYKTEDLFKCSADGSLPSSVIFPEQEVSEKKDQLQLEWFVLQKIGFWKSHCKPAVYLYPEEKLLVNVKVFPKGELSYTDPPYDPNLGWSVYAHPDGKLLGYPRFSAIPNNYLYYESRLFDSEIKIPDKGWVVNGEAREVEKLFNQILPELGLNIKEANDFKEYWLKTLPKSPYYFIGVIEKEQRDYLEVLEVTPKPETSIRFSLFFEPLEQFKFVTAPEISTPVRSGFTLVDWGGMIKLHQDTLFTCSQ